MADSAQRRPPYLFITIALLAAAFCIYAGTWQLDRHGQRRAHNQAVEARIQQGAVSVEALFSRDTADPLRFRAASIEGEPDYEHEIVVATRTHNGSPGVHILTPVHMAGHDAVVLVNRGWVYSPDGVQVDLARWRDTARAFSGYVEEFTPAQGTVVLPSRPRTIRRLDRDSIATLLPYELAPVFVVQTGDGPAAPDRPALAATPALGDGPHFSYAMQWFGFALVAIVGAAIVTLRRFPPGRRGVGAA